MRVRRTESPTLAQLLLFGVVALAGCSSSGGGSASEEAVDIFALANQCAVVRTNGAGAALHLARTGEDGFEFSAAAATRFFFKASRLGTYLLYDDERGFLVSDDGAAIGRKTSLLSEIILLDDDFESEAEWDLVPAAVPQAFHLIHRRSGAALGTDGLTLDDTAAAAIVFEEAGGCAPFPEEETHSTGTVAVTKFEDGAVFGFVDAHSHILSNFAFGGGGIFHGAPFHPLGIEHALGDCRRFHGNEGRADLFGGVFDAGAQTDVAALLPALLSGRLPFFNHHTDGYPTFTDWPNAHSSSTHQMQYYKWIERAYLGGLRLIVQHAVNNQVICDFLAGTGIQRVRYSCNDMVGVDRQLEEIFNMQDYIDAQEGGPGRGWFRIVTSPGEAREVIRAGKLAVILGIETSNLFDCFLTPSPQYPSCNEQDVLDRLDAYHARGVRALFPVHKYDNAFSAGDGHKGFIELGNAVQTGHFSNFTTDCDPEVPSTFDRGAMNFPGINQPRANYFDPAPNDFSEFYRNIIGSLGPFINLLLVPPIPGEDNHCQADGLTELGEFLIDEMMLRGMILEVDHLPRHGYRRAFEMLRANDYPAVGTHGLDNFGELYALGGVATSGFGRCRDENRPGSTADGFRGRLATIIERGGYPGLGFGLDLNGFAGAPGPRFGPNSVCGRPQSDPLTYPFTSFAGDVTFTQPSVGERLLDFNTEGFVHIGFLPEIIEEVRRDGVSAEDLEPLFRSAEGYLRMWEKAEARGAALRSALAAR